MITLTTISKGITKTISLAVLLTSLSMVPAFASNAVLINQVFTGPQDAITDSSNEASWGDTSSESGGMDSVGNQAFTGPQAATTESGSEAPAWSDATSESGSGILSWTPYVAPQPKPAQVRKAVVELHIPELQVVNYNWN